MFSTLLTGKAQQFSACLERLKAITAREPLLTQSTNQHTHENIYWSDLSHKSNIGRHHTEHAIQPTSPPVAQTFFLRTVFFIILFHDCMFFHLASERQFVRSTVWTVSMNKRRRRSLISSPSSAYTKRNGFLYGVVERCTYWRIISGFRCLIRIGGCGRDREPPDCILLVLPCGLVVLC